MTADDLGLPGRKSSMLNVGVVVKAVSKDSEISSTNVQIKSVMGNSGTRHVAILNFFENRLIYFVEIKLFQFPKLRETVSSA